MSSPPENQAHWDSTFQLMPWWKQEVVDQASVLVVGAGALGNEVIKNLTLLGTGHIFILDFDTIEYSNLSRSILYRDSDCGRKKVEVAKERIKEINNKVKVQTLDGNVSADLGLGVLRRMDVIIGCLDNRLARLHLNRACHKVGKTWIDGGILGLGGQAHVFEPGKTCYECTLSSRDKELLEWRQSCPDIATQWNAHGRLATTPISASIVGAIQAQEALKVIHQETDKVKMLGESFYYEGRSNTMLQPNYPALKSNCPSHFQYDPIIESPLSSDSKVEEAVQWLAQEFTDKNPYITLDHPIVLEVTSRKSELRHELLIPRPHLQAEKLKRYQTIPGEEIVITKSLQGLSKDFPHQQLSLKACGIPPLHILKVLTDKGEKFVELSGDEHFINFQ